MFRSRPQIQVTASILEDLPENRFYKATSPEGMTLTFIKFNGEYLSVARRSEVRPDSWFNPGTKTVGFIKWASFGELIDKIYGWTLTVADDIIVIGGPL